MSKTKSKITALLILVMIFPLFSYDLATDWLIAGNCPESYEMGIERNAGPQSKDVFTIKSIDKKISGFGTLMQNSLPDKYLGKRIRMSAYVKTKDVQDWSGLWLRIDEKESGKYLCFDNMHDGKTNRSLKGTNDWKKYEIVLDVPLNSLNLGYGALINGTGQIWFYDFKFETVDISVPTTGITSKKQK